jgi:hypothetical protein
MFISSSGSALFMGSTALDEYLKSEEYQEIEYRRMELILVQLMEFLQLFDFILDLYDNIYLNKRKKFMERRKRGEIIRPSEVMEIRDALVNVLEEYDNVSVFGADPNGRVMEYGKKRLMLSRRVDRLTLGLQELSDMARSLYEEEISRKQTSISVKHALLTAYFGLFGAIEVLKPLWPVPEPLNTIAIAIFLSYPIYELLSFLYRRTKG